jgi:hypothetical protein
MSDAVDALQMLLEEMETALVANDVNRVHELNLAQQVAVADLRTESENNPQLKKKLALSAVEMQRQLERNQLLLEQGSNLVKEFITMAYARDASKSSNIYTKIRTNK